MNFEVAETNHHLNDNGKQHETDFHVPPFHLGFCAKKCCNENHRFVFLSNIVSRQSSLVHSPNPGSHTWSFVIRRKLLNKKLISLGISASFFGPLSIKLDFRALCSPLPT
jgi:hypothetical protein